MVTANEPVHDKQLWEWGDALHKPGEESPGQQSVDRLLELPDLSKSHGACLESMLTVLSCWDVSPGLDGT